MKYCEGHEHNAGSVEELEHEQLVRDGRDAILDLNETLLRVNGMLDELHSKKDNPSESKINAARHLNLAINSVLEEYGW